nr:MAG TPA: hypothetical protein [Caudoviricetes sp.]
MKALPLYISDCEVPFSSNIILHGVGKRSCCLPIENERV